MPWERRAFVCFARWQKAGAVIMGLLASVQLGVMLAWPRRCHGVPEDTPLEQVNDPC